MLNLHTKKIKLCSTVDQVDVSFQKVPSENSISTKSLVSDALSTPKSVNTKRLYFILTLDYELY